MYSLKDFPPWVLESFLQNPLRIYNVAIFNIKFLFISTLGNYINYIKIRKFCVITLFPWTFLLKYRRKL